MSTQSQNELEQLKKSITHLPWPGQPDIMLGNIGIKDGVLHLIAEFIQATYISKADVVAAIGDDYLPDCFEYPDTSTHCNKCFACKVRNDDDFNKGYEYKTQEVLSKLSLPDNTEAPTGEKS